MEWACSQEEGKGVTQKNKSIIRSWARSGNGPRGPKSDEYPLEGGGGGGKILQPEDLSLDWQDGWLTSCIGFLRQKKMERQ